MNEKLIQGSIIGHIRSPKYEKIRCWGILITARCDLVQEKVDQAHCLVALDLNDWISDVLVSKLIESYKKERIFASLRDVAKSSHMDYETLVGFSKEKIRTVCKENCVEKDYKNVEKVLEQLEVVEQLDLKANLNEKIAFILKEYKKKFQHELRDLYEGKNYKYCFLPQKAYTSESGLLDGLVVDLQNIVPIGLNECKRILANEYDCKIIEDEKEKARINNMFFFESPSDFVIFSGCIVSPWIEYIMQKFSFSFTRIGVETPSKDETEDYVNRLIEEYKDKSEVDK